MLTWSVLIIPSSSCSSSSLAALLWLWIELTSSKGVDGHHDFVARLLSLLLASSFLLPDFTSSISPVTGWKNSSVPSCFFPSCHPGLTLLCNDWALADLLPTPTPSPPFILSLPGKSALHWASTVNNLSLARTLICYGAAVDLQDNKVSPNWWVRVQDI